METTAQLTLSDAAARHILKIVATTNGAVAVRLEVLGGGCSGYQYRFGFAEQIDDADDMIITRDGAQLVVDKTSLDLLKGSEVDYGESLLEAGFQVKNPNATSSCGCGTSFAV